MRANSAIGTSSSASANLPSRSGNTYTVALSSPRAASVTVVSVRGINDGGYVKMSVFRFIDVDTATTKGNSTMIATVISSA